MFCECLMFFELEVRVCPMVDEALADVGVVLITLTCVKVVQTSLCGSPETDLHA